MMNNQNMQQQQNNANLLNNIPRFKQQSSAPLYQQ
jgi:hypothetical protein